MQTPRRSCALPRQVLDERDTCGMRQVIGEPIGQVLRQEGSGVSDPGTAIGDWQTEPIDSPRLGRHLEQNMKVRESTNLSNEWRNDIEERWCDVEEGPSGSRQVRSSLH
jgi:hypothetical protein